MSDEFLKIDELASRMGVSTATVRRLRKARGLPSHTWGRRTVRFRWSDIEAWICEQRGESNVG